MKKKNGSGSNQYRQHEMSGRGVSKRNNNNNNKMNKKKEKAKFEKISTKNLKESIIMFNKNGNNGSNKKIPPAEFRVLSSKSVQKSRRQNKDSNGAITKQMFLVEKNQKKVSL